MDVHTCGVSVSRGGDNERHAEASLGEVVLGEGLSIVGLDHAARSP